MKQQREELARELVRKDSQMKEMQQRLESGDGCKYWEADMVLWNKWTLFSDCWIAVCDLNPSGSIPSLPRTIFYLITSLEWLHDFDPPSTESVDSHLIHFFFLDFILPSIITFSSSHTNSRPLFARCTHLTETPPTHTLSYQKEISLCL